MYFIFFFLFNSTSLASVMQKVKSSDEEPSQYSQKKQAQFLCDFNNNKKKLVRVAILSSPSIKPIKNTQ